MKVNNQIILKVAFLSLMLVGAITLSSINVSAQEKEEKPDATLATQAKITMKKAKSIALARAPGKIEDAELEKEHGKLVYSFDIRNKRGTITEVQVNAKNGKIVSVAEENAAAEAKEKTEDAKKKGKN
jgi:uncharacterized membrane protein YkoI